MQFHKCNASPELCESTRERTTNYCTTQFHLYRPIDFRSRCRTTKASALVHLLLWIALFQYLTGKSRDARAETPLRTGVVIWYVCCPRVSGVDGFRNRQCRTDRKSPKCWLTRILGPGSVHFPTFQLNSSAKQLLVAAINQEALAVSLV